MTKSSQLWPALMATSLALIAPHQAQAVETIDFEQTGCINDGTTFCRMPDTYADTDKVDVSYGSVHLQSGTRSPGLHRYGVGYGDLNGVVFTARNIEYAAELQLAAATGFELSLLSFDFATFAGRVPTLPFRITNLAGNLISEGVRSTGGAAHSNYAVTSTFGDGVIIRWGPNAHDAGLDNIRYEVRAIAASVPEPGTWAMLILGFGLIGAIIRRRQSVKFVAA